MNLCVMLSDDEVKRLSNILDGEREASRDLLKQVDGGESPYAQHLRDEAKRTLKLALKLQDKIDKWNEGRKEPEA